MSSKKSSPIVYLPLTAALAAEDSTGAITVHLAYGNKKFFRGTQQTGPLTVQSADWPGSHSHETVAHGDHVCGLGCGPTRYARHQIQPPGTRNPIWGQVVGVPWCGLCGSINSTHSSVRGTPLGSWSSRLASVWHSSSPTDRPTAPSESQVPSRPTLPSPAPIDLRADTWAAIF
jgi:hypothetical protein